MLKRFTTFVAALSMLAGVAHAKTSPEEAARLGKDLTAIGSEKAGNASGTIPAWTATARHGAPKEYSSDPSIDAEKPLFTITRANLSQYADKLTVGHKKLLSTYDTYKMNVYPSHRVVTWPDFIQKATVDNATRCELVDVDTLDNCKQGFPFPVPNSGAEVIWNHKLKYRGESARRYNNQMIVQANGDFQLTKITEDVKFYYAVENNPVPLTKIDGLLLKYISQTISPPRLAGTIILVHEKSGTDRAAWIYSPGLKRVRRAPTVCCDNPYEGTDGHQFYDQVDMFNGVLERYDWKLVGKKEIYIPYMSSRLASPPTKYADIARPHHLNQDLPRYQLHRVWIVDATLRPGTSHTFSKRRLYVDEDSWNIVAVDDYDARGILCQFQEGHLMFAANILSAGTSPEVIYHFDSGRYFVTAMANEDLPPDTTVRFDDEYFDPSNLQKRATK